ncbi:unnamed protein product [Urochloa decumbens]|uniref:Disease resistance protein At4g27190-like leucine-rich repeats domain-containing protein n=1 Tax=Urochloa decumbens TaxID=240449 RepID=A0ABC9BSZ3_9POAL
MGSRDDDHEEFMHNLIREGTANREIYESQDDDSQHLDGEDTSKTKYIYAKDVETALEKIVPYLEDTSNDAPRVICYNGWRGLGASTVLRAIAEHPPPSLWEKFNKIIHIDCSMWTSRRSLQRVIADKLNLTQMVAADFDKQDYEDDFNGIDQGSRGEIGGIATVIARYLAQYRFLVVFHNGSDDMVDLTSCGIPPPELFHSMVLWCFSARLRFIDDRKSLQAKHSSVRFIEIFSVDMEETAQLAEEAREIAFYTDKLGLGVTPEIVKECYIYLLSLKGKSRNMMDYKWTTHAASYWVCDGIIQGGQDNRAWELAHALQQHITLEDDSSFNMATMFGLIELKISTKQWICNTFPYLGEVPPGTTSLFFEPKEEELWGRPIGSSLSSVMFHQAGQLRVLKLWRCSFSFSSPPFHCCSNLRFLGLVSCADEKKLGEEETSTLAVEIFQRLWVLDVCRTNWQLSFPVETEEQEQVAADIREVHIDKGRIWRSNLAWKRMPNLHRLRVVEPTSPWETGKEDEFMGMVKLEFLDLSGNITMQVLPSLSGATCLTTLVLDGCVRLEHVGPQGLPPSLESFCFDAGSEGGYENKARISRISLAGCSRLTDFRLCGSLPNLEELDLSQTAVKMLNLEKVVQLGNLQRLLLMGCEQLRSISWSRDIFMDELRQMCIDTRAGREVDRKPPLCDSSMVYHGEGNEYCLAFVAVADMSFLRTLLFLLEWVITIAKFKLNLCWSSIIKDDGRSCHKEKMCHPDYYSSGLLAAGSPLPKSLAYHDISIEQIATKTDDVSNAKQFQPLDFHMEIGEGISDVTTDTVSEWGRKAIRYFMDKVKSLHVHDSSSITTVVPENIFTLPLDYYEIMNGLKWCRVERCPMLDTVFATDKHFKGFSELEIFWASHLLMARSIWSRPRNPRFPRPTADTSDDFLRYITSFKKLWAIHIHSCPRLRSVLDLSWHYALSNQLETLHILCCGDLRHIFTVEQEFLKETAASCETRGMLEFPKLKNLYLHDLPSLKLICEAKMFAANLETIYIRGCWGLRRLPATDTRRRLPVAVDCEKDWWDNLEWDGMEFGHHPSLFEAHHSKYYNKRHLRSTVLR